MKHITMTMLVALALYAIPASAQSPNANNAWGVNASNNIYHLTPTGWVQVPPPPGVTMAQVSVSPNGVVSGVDKTGAVWMFHTLGWQMLPGNLKQISAGSSSISTGSWNAFGGGSPNTWGVNGGGTIYQWNGSTWTMIASNFAAAQVSVGSDGTVWALDQQGNIYSYTSAATWQTMTGSLIQVSVSNASNVWGINNSNNIYQWNGTSWANISAPPLAGTKPAQVSAGADGTVYLLDTAGNIYVQSTTGWTQLSGNLLQISAAMSDCITYYDGRVSNSGAWAPVTSASALAGSYLQSATPGDTITLTFSGDTVALFRLMDPNGGMASVSVDRKAMGNFDFYFPQTRWQVPAVLDHLGAGPHTLILTVNDNGNAASGGRNVYVDTFGSPAPFLPGKDQKTALARVNFHRQLAGLPAADTSLALNLSAQAHASYNAVNGLSHDENPTIAGFVGAAAGDRSAYFGYAPFIWEDAAQGGADANWAVDTWINSVYHRNALMDYRGTDIGFGLATASGSQQSVMDFGTARGSYPQSRLVITYPANGQKNVPLAFPGNEIPSPLPNGVTASGFPISVHIRQPANPARGNSTAPNKYELTDAGGKPVAAYVIDAGDGDLFMLPQQSLNTGATYQAHVSGTDNYGNPFDVSWIFSTVPKATISFYGGAPFSSTKAFVTWMTAGAVTVNQVSYGLTSAYGSAAGPDPSWTTGYLFTALLNGLLPNTTYHYQITTLDSQGNTYTTPDATFTTKAP